MAFTDRHAESYAAKWRADDNDCAPTDEALRRAFASCVRPARAGEYDAIRRAIRNTCDRVSSYMTPCVLPRGHSGPHNDDPRDTAHD